MIKTAPIEFIALAPLPGLPLRLVVLGLLLLSWPAIAQTPPTVRHDLLSVGPVSGQTEWLYLARTTAAPGASNDPPALQTQIYRRTPSRSFTPFGKTIPRRVISMTPVGDNVAVLTEDGQWMLQLEDGVTPGLPLALPEASLIDLASDGAGFYAVAKVLGGVARLAEAERSAIETSADGTAATVPSTKLATPATGAATVPATVPTTATRSTTAASRPLYNAPDTLVIVEYSAGGWKPVTDIPFQVARPLDTVSLAMLDRTHFLLVREAPEQIRLWRLDGLKWSEVGQARITANTRITKLISGGARPTVWLSPPMDAPGEPDQVLVFDAAGLGVTRSIPRGDPATVSSGRPAATQPATNQGTATQPVDEVNASGLANHMKLSATNGVAPNMRSAAFAFNYFRSITFEGTTVIDQAYDPVTFAAVESPRRQTIEPPGLDYFELAQYALVAAAMAFAIMASLRRRTELMSLEIDPETLPLAPLGTRLLAGTIDAAPLLAALFHNAIRYGTDAAEEFKNEANLILAVGFGVYLLITLLTEVFAGRSLGKMLCGLRVITVAGKPPSKGQLATRNILRIIDVVLQGFPLLLIPFSPLRQRAGDAAAGTIVVTIHPRKPTTEDDVADETAE